MTEHEEFFERCIMFGKEPSLRDLLNRAALAIDCMPDPTSRELKLVTELRNFNVPPESEWQRRALAAEAEVARLRAQFQEDLRQRDALASVP